jgi:uncharacterized protein YukE
MIGANMPVEELERLAQILRMRAAQLENELNALRDASTRDARFTGSAAARYDQFLSHWDASQQTLLDSLKGASRILATLSEQIREADSIAAAQFDN